ncbi:LacI family transcriptional regulator [Puniceicoccaceae bacterium K14]|nr:LacI family transcriptional regulator [Puniceicoccaceae bacterium K14]
MASKKLNQKDIAEKLNISPATVSLVLRSPETSRASKETKKRILELASSMRQNANSADTVLFLTDESILRFHYGNSMLSGAQARAAELGLKFEIITPAQDLSTLLATRKARGLLVSSFTLLDPRNTKKNLNLPLRIATLNIERRAPFSGIAIASDHFEGMHKAITRFIEMGHKRIAFVGYKSLTSDTSASRTRERTTIFHEALEACGINPSDSIVHLIRDPKQETEDRSEEIRDFLRSFTKRKRPTAIIAFNDLLAFKIINVALREGINVPADLSIIGIDNEPLCENSLPTISSISPEFSKMGRVAVNVINDDNLWTAEDRPSRIVISSNLIERESIAETK